MTYSLLGNHVDEKSGKTHKPRFVDDVVKIMGWQSSVKKCKGESGCKFYKTFDHTNKEVERHL